MTARLQLVPEDQNGEVALARRAASGDEAAFAEVYQAHAGRVFALCLRMSGSRQRAAELTQDVFVQVWRRIATWRGESALSSWIHRLAVNLVLSAVRGEHRRNAREMNESDLDDTGGESDDHGRQERRAAATVGREPHAAIDLERAIAALPKGARTVFVLHDVEGYQHNEIARLTGTAEGTCRAQLHRARKLLMEALER